MFEQDVAGLIKALRANKHDEQSVIEQALEECRQEIRSSDIEIKAAAVLKLVYLEMLGQPIGFASFAIVECMSSTKFHIKTIGYLAASQSFTQDTEVALLVVNLIKKDLSTPPTSSFAASSATALTLAHLQMVLSALSTLLTPTLARDLGPDLLALLSHSRPAIRKQAMLLLWKIARSWPGVVEVSFPRSDEDPWIGRLRERLEDDDPTVVSATVNLVCELARRDPKTYLSLAPELFGLLTGGTNNWMLIKIVKLFAVLTPHEPRLVKKLVPPLTELIETTPAMSLLYECIQTSIVGGILQGAEGEALASTCVDKLHTFLEDVDQNLRYIALMAIHKILPTHPHLVAHEFDTIKACLDDPDLAIRSRALSIIEGMVDRDSLESTVEKLMGQLTSTGSAQSAAQSLASTATAAAAGAKPSSSLVFSASYKRTIVSSIVRMCSANTYAAVTDFEWYIDTLVSLARMTRLLSPSGYHEGGDNLGHVIKNALIDVSARVKAIRPYAVSKCDEIVRDETFVVADARPSNIKGGGAAVGPEDRDACVIAQGAAWVVGEYCAHLEDPRPTIASFFASSSFGGPGSNEWTDGLLTSYLNNGTKVYSAWLSSIIESMADGESTAGLLGESESKQVRDVTSALKRRCEECADAAASPSAQRGQLARANELARLYALVLESLDSSSSSRSPKEGLRRSKRLDGIMRPLFDAFPLNPVNARAQSMVAVPEGLDLDTPLCDVPLPSASTNGARKARRDEDVDDFGRPIGGSLMASTSTKGVKSTKKKKKDASDGADESTTVTKKKTRKKKTSVMDEVDDVDSIPIVRLDLDDADAALRTADTVPKKKKKPVQVMEVDVDGELPPGAEAQPPVKAVEVERGQVEQDDAVQQGVAAATPVTEAEAKKVVVVKKKRKATSKKSGAAAASEE